MNAKVVAQEKCDLLHVLRRGRTALLGVFLLMGSLLGGDVFAAVITSAQSGNWNAGSTWVGGSVPAAGDRVLIANTHIVTLTANATVADVWVKTGGTLQGDGNGPWTFTAGKGGGEDFTVDGTLNFSIGNGVILTLAKNGVWGGAGTWNLSRLDTVGNSLDLTQGGTKVTQLNFSGNATPLSGTGSIVSLVATIWNFTGSVAQTLTTNTSVQYGSIKVTNTTSVTLGTALTTANLLANLSVLNGTLSNGGFAITGVSGATFSVANGATFKLTGTTSMVTGFTSKTFGQGSPTSTPPCSTVDYAGAAQTVSIESYGNLTLSGSATKTPAAGTMNVACNLTLASAVSYAGNTNNPVVNLQGNLSNSGTFTSGTGLFSFNGTSAQTLTGATSFNNVALNNTTGLTINNNVTVSTVLTLSSGVLSTGTNSLITSASCASSVSRTSGWIAGNLQLVIPTTNPVTCTFPVGDASNYAPITVTKTGANTGTLTGTTTAGDHADTTAGTSGINAAKSVNRTWTLTGGTLATGTPYSAKFQFCSAVGSGCGVNDVDSGAASGSFIVAEKVGASWSLPTLGTLAATSTQATGLAAFGTFAVGEASPPVVVSINRAGTDPTTAATVSWTVTFSKSVTGVDASAFTLIPSVGLSGTYIMSVTGSGTTWTVTANTGIGSGTLGLNQTGPGSVVPTLSGTFIGQVYTISSTPALAEYRMDEASWNGSANEVVDSSGSGNHAQAFNSASTTDGARAIAGSPGTCRYGVFDDGGTITKGYVQTPLPNLTTDFTVTAWIKTTDNTIAGQRILIDDQGSAPATGYGISLADGTAGRLRFYSRGITPVILDSTYTIANNTWYFVAAVADITNKKRTIYVFNTAGTLLNSTTEAAWTGGSWGTDAGPVSIGAETNASGELPATYHFHGNLDEVRVYPKVLSQSAVMAIATQTHACTVNVPDHLVIQSTGTGVTCTPSTLTVVACADASCATPYTLGVSGILTATGTPTVNWDGTTGGAAGANFIIPAGVSSVTKDVQVTTPGTVVFGISTPAPVPINATTCSFGTPSCTFTATDAGFLVSAPNHVAETASTLTVKAVKKADNSLACVPVFKSVSKTVNLKCAYVNPATGTLPVRVGGAALNSANNAAAACDASGGGVSLSFDATGVATPSLQYADVGNMQIDANFSGTAGTKDAGLSMSGSGTFIAAPASFAFSGVTSGLIKAGSAFAATITAQNALGASTPNFGKESAAEGVTLTANLVAPVGGFNPAIGNNGILGGTFTNGVATVNNLSWGEVGLITLTGNLTSLNYLTSGVTSATGTSGNVGRFIPDHFDTVVKYNTLAKVFMPCPSVLTCPSSGDLAYVWSNADAVWSYADAAARTAATGFVVTEIGRIARQQDNNTFWELTAITPTWATASAGKGFVYSGQTFSTQVTAKNLGSATTRNYDNALGYSKLVALSAWNAQGGGTAGSGAMSANAVPASAFNLGVATTNTPVYTFPTATTAPADVYVRAIESAGGDGVTSLRVASSVEGGMKIVSGRYKISNAYGSELLRLVLTASVQYWNGASWVNSTTDSVTAFNTKLYTASGDLHPVIVTGPLAVGNISVVAAGPVTVATGARNFTLNIPTVTGIADIGLDAPLYLLGANNGAGVNPSVNGRVTFGVYSGNNDYIYRRENY